MSSNRLQPLREFASWREAVNSVVDPTRFGRGAPPMDIIVRPAEIIVQASIPGFDPARIDIQVHGDTLVLKGTMDKQQETRNQRYYLRERHAASFQRTVRLPGLVDTDNADAEIRNGLLTLRLPRLSVEPASRKVKVKAGSAGVSPVPTPVEPPATTDAPEPSAEEGSLV